MSTDAIVTSDPDQSRFEIHTSAGRRAGFTDYVESEGVREFTHTEVDDDFEGQGLGSALIRTALDRTRLDGLTVKATCPFVKSWIDKHPDYQDLLA